MRLEQRVGARKTACSGVFNLKGARRSTSERCPRLSLRVALLFKAVRASVLSFVVMAETDVGMYARGAVEVEH